MAIHLKMDFRVVELTADRNVLQCDRGSDCCLYEVEYNNKLAGALIRAIHQFRGHLCEPVEAAPSQPKSVGLALPARARKFPNVASRKQLTAYGAHTG